MLCKRCGKDEEFFPYYKHYCKKCYRKRKAIWRAKNKEKIYQYDRSHILRHKDDPEYRKKLIKYSQKKNDKLRGLQWALNREAVMEWRKNNPEKLSAQRKLQYAVKTGVVIRPDKCSQCDRETKPQAHHYDYVFAN